MPRGRFWQFRWEDSSVCNGFAIERSGRDSDGDGLLDSWEINGLKNPDGSLVRDHNGRPVLPPGRANPRHKDLFVEVDYMASHQLKRDLIALKAAFAVAPKDAGGITNPDGLAGITLWIDAGLLFLVAPWATTLAAVMK